ncbi:MAG: DUF4292 domain-containing protein [Bacteroidaceae bacterium]|nr:DUF4292 domain-containing protein [Bacteroidaceae bacterium]
MPIKRRRNKIPFISILFLALLLAGCRSTKKDGLPSGANNLLPLVQQMQALQPIEGSISGKLKMEALLGEKKLSVGGTLGVEKNTGLQLAVTALGLFEVARVESTPVDICLINKVGKEYARADYSPSSPLGAAGLSYNLLQAVFLNEPFMPDGTDFYDSLSKITLLREDGNIIAVTPEHNKMRYTFTFDAATGELRCTEGVYNGEVRIMCHYSEFEKLDKRTFPSRMKFEIQGAGTPVELYLHFSNLKEGRYSFQRTALSSYRKKDIKEIIKALE